MAFLKIAHRGASGTRPESTRAAFERALEIGVDMIELDVHLTRDRRLVVTHDRRLGRTVRGSGYVRDKDWEELRRLDAGSWFDPAYASERILLLDEVLDFTCGRARLNVEIKSPRPDWDETARVLIDLLEWHGRLEDTIISCFDTGALERVRVRAAAARIGVLWKATDLDDAWAVARHLRAISLHLLWALADRKAIESAHERGLQIIAWTVNEIDAMRVLVKNGVDGIISDFPERFAQLA